MELSLISDEQILAMDDSFILYKPDNMDDEVTQILKKWNLSNPAPITNVDTRQTEAAVFDSRTFTRPKRLMSRPSNAATAQANDETNNHPVNLQIGAPISTFTMQRSWLNDVSPPSSIGTSMDYQNCDNMLNSLITSSDFSNVSFLLNATNGNESVQKSDRTITIQNGNRGRKSENLMDFTFNVEPGSSPNKNQSNITYNARNDSLQTSANGDADQTPTNNITYNANTNKLNKTWDGSQNELNKTIVQSTPVQQSSDDINVFVRNCDRTMSPITSYEEPEVPLRKTRTRKLIEEDVMLDDYRNSIEDQCEFLLNEETIKLSSRVCRNETFDLIDPKTTFIESADVNEKEFDKMLDSFSVKKSQESEKLLQTLDNIKHRHSLINLEKQREEKSKKDMDQVQPEVLSKSTERLLMRRSRLYDDINLQLQKHQNENYAVQEPHQQPPPEANMPYEQNDRDRFKTIKINKKLQNGMVVVEPELNPSPEPEPESFNLINTENNKDFMNQLNQKKQDFREIGGNSRLAQPSKLSKFGFTRPAYKGKSELNLPLQSGYIENHDAKPSSNLKSPMGVKSKSIHSLVSNFGGARNYKSADRQGSYGNLRLISDVARSQSNLKTTRASSVARGTADSAFKVPSTYKNPVNSASQAKTVSSRKPGLVRPSSGYYGNSVLSARRVDDSDESGNSLSSSSASSRNSVHMYSQNADQQPLTIAQALIKSDLPKPSTARPSGLRPPSNLRMPTARSGLPRPERR